MDPVSTRYQLTFETRSGYLFAFVKADTIDRETALNYLLEVADKCTETGVSRLMLERDIPVMLSDTDLFFTTQDFLEMTGKTKIAFVNPHVPIRDEMKFAVMIGTNRGANCEVFDDRDEAETWLLQGIDE